MTHRRCIAATATLLLIVGLASIGDAQSATLVTNGLSRSPRNAAILAEITDIPEGQHTFRVVVAATAGVAAVVELRDARNQAAKWFQLIAVPAQGGTATVAINEPQQFQSGERLRVGVLGDTAGMVQATLSLH